MTGEPALPTAAVGELELFPRDGLQVERIRDGLAGQLEPEQVEEAHHGLGRGDVVEEGEDLVGAGGSRRVDRPGGQRARGRPPPASATTGHAAAIERIANRALVRAARIDAEHRTDGFPQARIGDHVRVAFAGGRQADRRIDLRHGVAEEIVELIEGMEPAESDAMLEFLFRHQSQEKYLYSHRWTPGDVLMWDNIATTHNAVADYGPDEPRFILRVQVMATLDYARLAAD